MDINLDNGPVFVTVSSPIERDIRSGYKCTIRHNEQEYLVTRDSLKNSAILDCIQQWESATQLPANLASGCWRISRGGLPAVGILVKYCEQAFLGV